MTANPNATTRSAAAVFARPQTLQGRCRAGFSRLLPRQDIGRCGRSGAGNRRLARMRHIDRRPDRGIAGTLTATGGARNHWASCANRCRSCFKIPSWIARTPPADRCDPREPPRFNRPVNEPQGSHRQKRVNAGSSAALRPEHLTATRICSRGEQRQRTRLPARLMAGPQGVGAGDEPVSALDRRSKARFTNFAALICKNSAAGLSVHLARTSAVVCVTVADER